MKALQNSSSFYAARTLDGVIDLATEIGDDHIAVSVQDVPKSCYSFVILLAARDMSSAPADQHVYKRLPCTW